MEVRKLELSRQELSSQAYLVQSPEKGRHDLIEVPTEEVQRLKARGRLWYLCFPGSPLGTCAASSLMAQTLYPAHMRSGEMWGGDAAGEREMGCGGEINYSLSTDTAWSCGFPGPPSITPPDQGSGPEAWAAQSCPVGLHPSCNALSLQVSAESW